MSEVITYDVCAYGEVACSRGKGQYVYTEDYKQLERELQEAKESITEIYNIIHDMLDDDTSSKLPKELYKWAGKYPFHKWVIESEAGNE